MTSSPEGRQEAAVLDATAPDEAAHDLIMRAVDLACNHLIFYDQHFDIETRQKFWDTRDAMRQWLIDVADATLIPAKPAVEVVEALRRAEQFIVNGVELGYIRLPDAGTPDPAHDTLPAIRSALAAIQAPATPDAQTEVEK